VNDCHDLIFFIHFKISISIIDNYNSFLLKNQRNNNYFAKNFKKKKPQML